MTEQNNIGKTIFPGVHWGGHPRVRFLYH